MMTSVKGTYKNGRIAFAESPPHALNESEVIITFLAGKQDERKPRDLYGIGKGKISDDTDIEAIRREVISEWKQESEEYGDAA